MIDLVKIARARTHVDARTHYLGCEREHTECLIQMMAAEIEHLRAVLALIIKYPGIRKYIGSELCAAVDAAIKEQK